MPEDENPDLDRKSLECVLYYTLPMALNYQRNSYSLWKSAKLLYLDPQRNYLFRPSAVKTINIEQVRSDLLFYKVALQPNKHINTWVSLCQTFEELYNSDVRNLFIENNYDIAKILETIQVKYKKRFPYLSGHKIANYWLYVLTQYTDLPFHNLEALSVAPDTHVVQASLKLGLIDTAIEPQLIAKKWQKVLTGSGINPIQIHTPLWLWSRNNFQIGKHKNTLL